MLDDNSLKGITLEVIYSNKKVEKLCTNQVLATRKLGDLVSGKLMMAINFLMSAENLKDVQAMPQYHLHLLKGDLSGHYAMDLGRKLGYRIILIPLDKNGNILEDSNEIRLMVESVKIKIEEVSNHYD